MMDWEFIAASAIVFVGILFAVSVVIGHWTFVWWIDYYILRCSLNLVCRWIPGGSHRRRIR